MPFISPLFFLHMTLTREFVFAYLSDGLKTEMEQAGYTWLEGLNQFRKTAPQGFTNFILSVSTYEDGAMVEAHVGMQLKAIEEWGQRFTRSLPGFYADAHTVIISEGKLKNKAFLRHFVADTDQLDSLVTHLVAFWYEYAQPFYEDHFSLKGVDQLLNAEPDKPSRFHPNPAHGFLKGIVAAKLVQRYDFELLVSAYEKALGRTPTGPQLLAGYKKLVQHLRAFSVN